MGDPGHAERAELATHLAELLESAGLTVAVAESLTGGMVASALAEAPGASRWFRGGVVAYASDVKHELLGVPPGPVVSADAAAAMAQGVRKLLRADLAVAVTGAGGPRGQDGQPPGTVFIGLSSPSPSSPSPSSPSLSSPSLPSPGLPSPDLADARHIQVEHRYFDRADPADICGAAVAEALRLLLHHLSSPEPDQSAAPTEPATSRSPRSSSTFRSGAMGSGTE